MKIKWAVLLSLDPAGVSLSCPGKRLGQGHKSKLGMHAQSPGDARKIRNLLQS